MWQQTNACNAAGIRKKLKHKTFHTLSSFQYLQTATSGINYNLLEPKLKQKILNFCFTLLVLGTAGGLLYIYPPLLLPKMMLF